MNIYKKALYMTIAWLVMAAFFASLFLPLDMKRYIQYYDVIATMWFAVIFGYYSRMWHNAIGMVFPAPPPPDLDLGEQEYLDARKDLSDKSDLYKALEKIDEGNLGSAKNLIERYINSH